MAQEAVESIPKLQVIPAATPASATFVIDQEDHTLGNSLRYMLMRQSDTQFCGYSVPHPSEPTINVRLQTTGRPAADVFRDGLQGLIDASTHIEATFIRACASAGVTLTPDDMASATPEVLAAVETAMAGGAGTEEGGEEGDKGKGKAAGKKGKAGAKKE